jgi:hypothetical protein
MVVLRGRVSDRAARDALSAAGPDAAVLVKAMPSPALLTH